MTNLFFHTWVHPENIHPTVVATHFGLYEWTAMSQGLKNAPSIHQHWMNTALCPLIGKICHIYITNIVIWLNTVAEHVKHTNMVMKSLITTCLFCNPKKCDFFLTKIDFLGHCISTWGIEPNTSKIQKILDWPMPTNLTEVWGFLGLVWYIASFLPKLADHTYPLTPLTNKSMKLFFSWTTDHQFAFESIKALIVRADCLTVIDHTNLEKNKIFVSCEWILYTCMVRTIVWQMLSHVFLKTPSLMKTEIAQHSSLYMRLGNSILALYSPLPLINLCLNPSKLDTYLMISASILPAIMSQVLVS